jgi:hypothetical protein
VAATNITRTKACAIEALGQGGSAAALSRGEVSDGEAMLSTLFFN